MMNGKINENKIPNPAMMNIKRTIVRSVSESGRFFDMYLRSVGSITWKIIVCSAPDVNEGAHF